MIQKSLIFCIFLLSLVFKAYAQEPVDTTVRRVRLPDGTDGHVAGVSISIKKVVELPPLPLVGNVTQLLQGRMAGVFATSTSGRPGAPAAIYVRGKNTIDGSSEPYYLFNNMPITVDQLSSINIEDIESVTVLKDAQATAAYGVNGGNGVVLIETKKGSARPMKVTLLAEAGVSNILKNKFGLMNTQQKLDYELGLGLINQATYNQRLPYNYNQIDEIFQTGWLQNYHLGLSGGNEKTSYYVSGGYYTQDGILDKSNFTRYSINAKVDTRLASWLKLGMNINSAQEKNEYPLTKENGKDIATNLPSAAITLNPYERLVNADGKYNLSLIHATSNPLRDASMFDDRASAANLSGMVFFDVSFCPKLSLRSSLVLGQANSTEYTTYRTISGSDHLTQLWNDNSNTKTIVQTNKLSFATYLDEVREHHISVSLSEELQAIGVDKMSNASTVPFSLLSKPSIEWNTVTGKERILSGLLQATYKYRDIFYVDANLRVDNIRFSGKEDHNTTKSWSLGLKWNALDNNKLSVRGSIGTVGYMPSANTLYSNLYTWGNTSLWNPEATHSYNIGIDSYLFNSKLALTVDCYLKHTSNVPILLQYSLNPWTPTYGCYFGGKVQNRGVELTLNWYALRRSNYYFTVGGNLSLNYNEIKNAGILHGLQGSSSFRAIKEGEPEGYSLLRWAGVNPINGYGMWLNSNGKPTETYAQQQFIEGKSYIPSKCAGIFFDGGYKNFSLFAQLYGVWDVYAYNANLADLETSSVNHNLTTRMAGYWRQAGDVTDIPKPSNYSVSDTRWLQNRSYLRLKHITLAYDFGRRTLKPLEVIQGCRIYATVQNLFTITKYKGYTPEVFGSTDSGAYPESMTVSMGVKITF